MIIKKAANPDKAATKRIRITALVTYIVKPEDENKAEKCVYKNSHGFFTDDIQGQMFEMIGLAEKSVRSLDPVNHYIISWRESEKPTNEQVDAAVDLVMEATGLTGHQVIYALHANTGNYHLHIVVNRVHPNSFKAIEINGGFEFKALHKAIARIERRQGWQPEKRALYAENENGELVENKTRKCGPPKAVGQKKRDKENLTGAKSAERIAQEEAAQIIRAATTWQALHENLAKHGFRYERHGSGAKLYVGETALKASSVDRSASLAKLQQRLGNYEAKDKPNDYFRHTPKPAKTGQLHAGLIDEITGDRLRNLSECHLARTAQTQKTPGVLHLDARAHRRAVVPVRREPEFGDGGAGSTPARGTATGASEHRQPVPLTSNQPGWADYIQGRQDRTRTKSRETSALRKRHSDEFQQLKADQRHTRETVLNGRNWAGKGNLRNATQSVLAAEAAKALASLKERQALERAQLRERHRRFPAYEAWLRDHNKPDLAEDWRHRRDGGGRQRGITGDAGTGPAGATQTPAPGDLRAFAYDVRENGVHYFFNPPRSPDFGAAFVDHGREIAISAWDDRAAVLAAMQLARQKFGEFRVFGHTDCPAYRRLCIEVAAEHGFKLANPELQDAIRQERERINAATATAAEPVLPANPAVAPEQRAFPPPPSGGEAHGKTYAVPDETAHPALRQLAAFGADAYAVGIFLWGAGPAPPGRMVHRHWTRDTLVANLGRLAETNRAGNDIFIRPADTTAHAFVLVDDIDAATVAEMRAAGVAPSIVVETGPQRMQAWVRLATGGMAEAERVQAATLLARLAGGDPVAAAGRPYGRLAGFARHTPGQAAGAGQPCPLRHLEHPDYVAAKGGAVLERARAALRDAPLAQARLDRTILKALSLFPSSQSREA